MNKQVDGPDEHHNNDEQETNNKITKTKVKLKQPTLVEIMK